MTSKTLPRRKFFILANPTHLNREVIMDNNKINLGNAAIVGENPDTAFIAKEGKLHAVDKQVAELDSKKKESDPKEVINLMTEGLKALVQFADKKVPQHFLELGQEIDSQTTEDYEELVNKIEQIYTHLPHHDRIALSSMVHHSQKAVIKQ